MTFVKMFFCSKRNEISRKKKELIEKEKEKKKETKIKKNSELL